MRSDAQRTRREAEGGERRVVREAQTSASAQIKCILDEASLTSFESNDPLGAAANQTASSRVHVCEVSGEVLALLQWRQVGPETEILNLPLATAHPHHGSAIPLFDPSFRT